MKPYNAVRERLDELVLYARCGIFPARQFPAIGYISNAERYPEFAELRSIDVQRWGESQHRPRRARCVRVTLMEQRG